MPFLRILSSAAHFRGATKAAAWMEILGFLHRNLDRKCSLLQHGHFPPSRRPIRMGTRRKRAGQQWSGAGGSSDPDARTQRRVRKDRGAAQRSRCDPGDSDWRIVCAFDAGQGHRNGGCGNAERGLAALLCDDPNCSRCMDAKEQIAQAER